MRRAMLVAGMTAALVGVAAPANATALQKLTVQTGSAAPSLYFIPVYVAEAAGFFKQEGLEVEVRYTRGAPVAAQIVVAGQADAGSFSFDPIVLGWGKGLRGKFFYEFMRSLIYYVAIPEESPIKSLRDLAGKKIGVASASSAANMFTTAMLRDAGVDPSKVSFVPVGVGNQAAAAIRSHQVDALALWNGPYSQLESLGLKFRYIRHQKLGGVGSTGYFATEQTIQARAKDLAGFCRAIAKATAFTLASPEAAVRVYWKLFPSERQGKDEQESLSRSVKELKFVERDFTIQDRNVKKYGYVDAQEMQLFIDVLKQETGTQDVPKASDIITNQFIDGANQFDPKEVERAVAVWRGS